jgi:hypothetical protein
MRKYRIERKDLPEYKTGCFTLLQYIVAGFIYLIGGLGILLLIILPHIAISILF